MLNLMIKDQNNITKLLYSDYKDNQLIYHGVKLVNNSSYDIGKQIFQEIYDLIKIKPHHKFLYNYQEYKVYYDDSNNIKHFIKGDQEDFLMFYVFNGTDATLYNKNNKRLKRPQSLKEFVIDGIKINIALSFVLTILTISPYYLSNLTTSMPNNIPYKYTENVSYIDTLSTNEAIDMIQSSPHLDEKEKGFLSNEKLLNDVLPFYQGTEMSYIIRERLKDIKIVYKKLDDGVKGCYCGDNIIYLDERYQNVDYNDLENGKQKLSILAHEFVHLLQSPNCSNYLTEATAELISNEYFFESTFCDSYFDATRNLMLLIETIGPKDIWNFTFSGKGNSFYNTLDKFLSKEDMKKLKIALNGSARDDAKNIELHNNISSMIEKLYRKIYNKDISLDANIFRDHTDNITFGPYNVKDSYFYQYNPHDEYVSFTFEEANNMGLWKEVPLYHYVKNRVTELEYSLHNQLKPFKNDSMYEERLEKFIEVDGNHPLFKKYPISSHSANPIIYNNEEYVEFYWWEDYNKKSIKMKLSDAIKDGIIIKINYKYHYYTLNKDDVPQDMILIETENERVPVDNTVRVKGDKVIKKVETIQDRFPDQIIMHDVNGKTFS